MKKTVFALVMIFVMLLSVGAAAQDITVTINGKVLESDVPAQIVNDRTMLPMRAIFEALGANVTWIEDDQLIFATHDNTLIVMQIGTPQMSVQKTTSTENLAVPLDTAPFITNGRTMVPVRAVAEALEADVDWLPDTRTVVIATTK